MKLKTTSYYLFFLLVFGTSGCTWHTTVFLRNLTQNELELIVEIDFRRSGHFHEPILLDKNYKLKKLKSRLIQRKVKRLTKLEPTWLDSISRYTIKIPPGNTVFLAPDGLYQHAVKKVAVRTQGISETIMTPESVFDIWKGFEKQIGEEFVCKIAGNSVNILIEIKER